MNWVWMVPLGTGNPSWMNLRALATRSSGKKKSVAASQRPPVLELIPGATPLLTRLQANRMTVDVQNRTSRTA